MYNSVKLKYLFLSRAEDLPQLGLLTTIMLLFIIPVFTECRFGASHRVGAGDTKMNEAGSLPPKISKISEGHRHSDRQTAM